MTSRRPYWCPKTMKRRHRGHSSGAPSDGMFPNTPEVSQISFLRALEDCLVNLELP